MQLWESQQFHRCARICRVYADGCLLVFCGMHTFHQNIKNQTIFRSLEHNQTNVVLKRKIALNDSFMNSFIDYLIKQKTKLRNLNCFVEIPLIALGSVFCDPLLSLFWVVMSYFEGCFLRERVFHGRRG